ncbi:hypothetical protein DL96DRAFT_472362 [Flagelloscypha sp. PMI_526]|nr:hypothetical protein DL96DRAFT_472362 [Flagelloscypha sp. PMI_526]
MASSLYSNDYSQSASNMNASRSETTLSHSGEAEPPSYGQVAGTTIIPVNGAPTRVTAGTYIFKAVDSILTILVPRSGGQAIYHTVKETLPNSQVTLVTIRKGPPGEESKLLATFEINGRDLIIIAGVSYPRSKLTTYGHLSPGWALLFRYGSQHKWTPDLPTIRRTQKPCLLCHSVPPPGERGRTPTVNFARYWVSDKMYALWNPRGFLEEPQLDVLEEGLAHLDEYIIGLVVLLLEKQDAVVVKPI